MSCTNILKNAVGIVGVIVIISICIIPIIKLATLMAVYYLGAAVCQPIADEKIVKLLCGKGMVDPFDDIPMEVSGSKNWS